MMWGQTVPWMGLTRRRTGRRAGYSTSVLHCRNQESSGSDHLAWWLIYMPKCHQTWERGGERERKCVCVCVCEFHVRSVQRRLRSLPHRFMFLFLNVNSRWTCSHWHDVDIFPVLYDHAHICKQSYGRDLRLFFPIKWHSLLSFDLAKNNLFFFFRYYFLSSFQ